MVFEHLADPKFIAAELNRVLRPGGWICAATPNKWGYIGLGARLVPNNLHTLLLKFLIPSKKEKDTFPTLYRLNTPRALIHFFPPDRFDHCSYFVDPGPAYHANRRWLAFLIQAYNWIMPLRLQPVYLIFLNKKS